MVKQNSYPQKIAFNSWNSLESEGSLKIHNFICGTKEAKTLLYYTIWIWFWFCWIMGKRQSIVTSVFGHNHSNSLLIKEPMFYWKYNKIVLKFFSKESLILKVNNTNGKLNQKLGTTSPNRKIMWRLCPKKLTCTSKLKSQCQMVFDWLTHKIRLYHPFFVLNALPHK